MAERRPVLSFVAAGLRRTGAALTGAPGVRRIRHAMHRADFRAGRPRDSFSGCYATFEEAERAAPSGFIGCDHEPMTMLNRDGPDSLPTRMDPNDYAALFWLRTLLPGARRLFGFGVNVGTAYYAYRRYLDFPPDFTWAVCGVPAMSWCSGRRCTPNAPLSPSRSCRLPTPRPSAPTWLPGSPGLSKACARSVTNWSTPGRSRACWRCRSIRNAASNPAPDSISGERTTMAARRPLPQAIPPDVRHNPLGLRTLG